MLRALFLAMTILVLPLGHASADAPSDLDSNAALKYWQAFAQLPRITGGEEQKLNAESLTMPLDAHAREIVTKADYALRMMHRAARLPRCAWGLSYEDGIDLLLPYAQAARTLSSLASLRARIRFEDGHNAEAIDDIVAAMTLGRHVSLDGSLIAVLVGYMVEHRMNETLALSLPKLNAETIKGLKARLAALPPFATPASALVPFEVETTLPWFARKVKETKDKESLLALLGQANSEGTGRDAAEKAAEKGRAFLQECGGTADGVLKMIEETRPSYTRTAKLLDLPLDQFEKEFALETKKQAGNPMFKLFFPAVSRMRRTQARADVRRAILAAALDVQLDGPDALKNHPDPVVGGPFEYVAFEGGFELRSKFKQSDDKPVSLTVGLRGK